MEKLMIKNALNKLGNLRLVLAASVGFPLIFASNTFAQLPAPGAPPPAPGAPPPSAEVERVIVTGSNIPTAEETGPNPVDTYRPQDIEKLGHPQRNRPEGIHSAGGGRNGQPDHRQRR